ncbi:GPI transamidase component PIG-T [Sparassis latifolia]
MMDSGVGTGAGLWVWMADGAPISVEERWQGLRIALAGLFCASLGSLDEQHTTSPTLSFQPEGSLPDWKAPHQLRHATLPSEHVCTKYLTPFLKLFPCKSLSGIAHLLNPHRIFDADWHGLGVNIGDHQNAGVEVRLTFQAVFDPFWLPPNKRRDWSLGSIFDRTIDRACPVTCSSEVRVELPGKKLYTLSPDPSVIIQDLAIFVAKDIVLCPCDISSLDTLDIAMQWPGKATFAYRLEPVRRRLSLVVTNNLPVQVQTGYLQTMPWLAQFYLHTLGVRNDGVSKNLVTIISYAAPVPHARPMLFQAALTFPPEDEHPPYAQRGWDLPPAIFVPFSLGDLSEADLNVSAAALTTLQWRPRRIYMSTLLVDLDTPDFSMPYVIIVSYTLIALIFGSVFNLLTRKCMVVSLNNEGGAGK